MAVNMAVSADIVAKIGTVAVVVSGILQGVKKLAPEKIKGNVAIGINIALSFLLTVAQHPSVDIQFLLTALGAAFTSVGIHSFLRPVSGVDEARPTVNQDVPEGAGHLAEAVGYGSPWNPALPNVATHASVATDADTVKANLQNWNAQAEVIRELKKQIEEDAEERDKLNQVVAEYVAELAAHDKINKAVTAMQGIDINKLSPMDAFNMIAALQNHAKGVHPLAPETGEKTNAGISS